MSIGYRMPLALAFLAMAGCSVLSPPPMRMLNEPVLRAEAGEVSLAASGGGGGGLFLKSAAGGEARVSVQATREMGLEASGGAGHVVETQDVEGSPSLLAFGRLGGVYRPTRLDWVTLRFGAGGGGADTGLTYGTTDVGVSFGYTFLRRVRPYGGVSLALSVPIQPGPEIGPADDTPRRPSATLWVGGSLGLAVRVVGRLELGVEGFCDIGWSRSGHDLESAPILGATGVIRYTFGPPH